MFANDKINQLETQNNSVFMKIKINQKIYYQKNVRNFVRNCPKLGKKTSEYFASDYFASEILTSEFFGN